MTTAILVAMIRLMMMMMMAITPPTMAAGEVSVDGASSWAVKDGMYI